MKIFDIATEVEAQIAQIERSRAVFAEVEHYFEGEESIKMLPCYAAHILNLLQAADGILYRVLPGLNAVASELYICNKSQKGGDAA